MRPSDPVPLTRVRGREPTGAPRRSSHARFAYALVDGDPAHPVTTASSGGLFGPAALDLRAESPTQRLRAARAAAPALTTGLAGPNAVVTLVAWVKRPATDRRRNFSYSVPHPSSFRGFLAGVWGDADGDKGARRPPQNARQYAMYFDLGACNGEAGHGGVTYHHGFAAHISATGGATPGHPYCVTAACDPRPLPPSDWHCVANAYDGRTIRAYVNGSLVRNGAVNPYPYPGGIYSPEAAGRAAAGAEFGVGVSMSFGVNQFSGLLGGLAVFNETLSQAQVAEVCAWPSHPAFQPGGSRSGGET